MFPWYYLHSDVFSTLKYSITQWCVTRPERVKCIYDTNINTNYILTKLIVHDALTCISTYGTCLQEFPLKRINV